VKSTPTPPERILHRQDLRGGHPAIPLARRGGRQLHAGVTQSPAGIVHGIEVVVEPAEDRHRLLATDILERVL